MFQTSKNLIMSSAMLYLKFLYRSYGYSGIVPNPLF
jgi:hypothetical protein